MQHTKQDRFRIKYLSYPKFQLTLIALNIFIIFGISTPMLTSVYYSLNKLKTMGQEAGIPSEHVYYRFLNLQEGIIESSLVWAAIVGIVISTIISIFISHRVAGPMVRLREHFKEIAETGKITPVKFRKGDYFSEVPVEINRALDQISKKL